LPAGDTPRTVSPAGNRYHFVLLDKNESCPTADLSNTGHPNGLAYSTGKLLNTPKVWQTYSWSSILHSCCTHISAGTVFQFLVQDGKHVGVCSCKYWLQHKIWCGVDQVVVYNIWNVGHFVVNSFENTFNFCVSVGLLNEKRKCLRCRRMFKLSVDHRDHTTTPVVLRCSNKSCPKATPYVMALFLTVQSCLWSGKTVWLPGLCPRPCWGAYSTPQTAAGDEGAGCPLPNNPEADWDLRVSILGPWPRS